MTEYRRLYDRPRWRRIKTYQLHIHPLCAWCMNKGIVMAASVVHHVVPHKGDETSFFTGALISLCKACHDGPAQESERSGFKTDIGRDGWPLDSNHPANAIVKRKL